MRTRFDAPEWQNAVATLIRSGDALATCNALVAAIGLVVDHEGTCLLAFHEDAPPDIVHHTLEPAGARHYLDRYLAGPYLLDPLYQLALRDDKPSLCRFRDQTPDRFRSSEYYRQYCERTHLLDEMDFLLDVSDRSTLALVVGRREKMFTKAELDRLSLIEQIVHAAMRNIWERWPKGQSVYERDDSLHRRLTQCFENFGEALLTDREREITQLLLRGHSAKSIAHELQIAPGTVMVHKRNLFAKLGITSQYELFSRFIEDLSRS
ncbi:MAG: helix-turn-helix transcriptional regulator [Gammaproteobacteria bacterium]|nr:helix-turn-helix transcriptional regulator [Gammaproteobacteria bacterium]MDH3749391.1 helix-turn-helix transcriptional regulator [Gammaproteobacteria bacterium]MDH3804067.1 helix-turn-helix transcriptional regulator [Gammaproteobacteria bacterium]